MEKENEKKEKKKAGDIPNLTFEDGVMLMDTVYRGLLKKYADEDVTPISEITGEAMMIIDNEIFREGYLQQRANCLMDQFDIDL